MRSLQESLLSAERLDLAAVLARWGDEYPFLCRLADFPCGERRAVTRRTPARVATYLAARASSW